jgi:hypothetical protein
MAGEQHIITLTMNTVITGIPTGSYGGIWVTA